jgi:excisionase family DNA binding protein
MTVINDAVHTRTETADILRISIRHLAKLIAEGKGPPTIKLGRRTLMRRSALDKWLADAEESSHDRAD